MHYWKSVITGIVVVSSVVLCSIGVFYWSKDSCPVGTFTCSTGGMCVPQRNVCDKERHCQNGDDEDPVLCTDINGSINMVRNHLNRSINDNYTKMRNNCEVMEYPTNCLCGYSVRIFCKNINLTEVPQNISTNVAHLILANNSITNLDPGSFKRYNLKLIHIEGNQLLNLPPKIFTGQRNLTRLFLMQNNLTAIKRKTFTGLSELIWLFLDHNQLNFIHVENFRDLISLEWLNLGYNQLKMENVVFPQMPSLMEMVLENNRIEKIERYLFSNLVNLELLSLKRNKITYIDEMAFENLVNLHELDLSENLIVQLPEKTFASLTLLTKMYLGRNPFRHVPSELFTQLENLASLNLEDIEIDNIDVTMFSRLTKLESVYFKKYKYCAYASAVPRCRPLSDGISSSKRLLVKPILRYATWIICFFTFVGNGLVLCGRFIFRDENKVLSVVIRNLAVSDMLMGLYLFIIGFHDLKFQDVYNGQAHGWMSSWTCAITGIVAMVSSEVSVLLLVFMSMERFLLIAVPFGHHSSITLKSATLVTVCIWAVGIGLAVVPGTARQMLHGTWDLDAQ